MVHSKRVHFYLKIVKLSRRQEIITVLHQAPGPVSYPDHDDRNGVTGGLDQGLQGWVGVFHLAVGKNEK